MTTDVAIETSLAPLAGPMPGDTAQAAPEGDGWLPPEAPLAMPRQELQRGRSGAHGLAGMLVRLIFPPLRD